MVLFRAIGHGGVLSGTDDANMTGATLDNVYEPISQRADSHCTYVQSPTTDCFCCVLREEMTGL